MTDSQAHPIFGNAIAPGWRTLPVDQVKADEPSSCVAGPFGSNISKKYFVDEGVPVIRGSNLTDDRTRFVPAGFVFVSQDRAKSYVPQHVVGGDLVFTCWGTIGQVGLIPEDGPYPAYVISNKQLKLRPNHDIADPLFLFYYFASDQMVQFIRSRAIGAAVPGINLGILKSLPVVLPPVPVQRRIAAVLAAYDELIENNLRRTEILEEMAQALYREWFVNFRFPGHKDVALVGSSLGPIPEGWDVSTLGDRVELAYGKALKADSRRSGSVPVLGSSGIVGWHDEALVDGPGIVVGRKGNVGSVHFVDADFFPIDTTFYVVSDLSLRYLLHNLRSQHFINSDAAVPGLNRNQAYSNPLIVPAQEVVDQFDAALTPMSGLVRNLQGQIANLRSTRDLLLPKLVSGAMDVSDLDIETEWLAS